MDNFAYHPPGLSPTRSNLPAPPPPHLAASNEDHFTRPGSSSGAGPSMGFTQTLPPLAEHATSDATSARPTLVGFEQLTGEDPLDNSAGLSSLDGLADGGLGADGHGLSGFRDPFARPNSPGSSALAASMPLSGGAAAPHSFFSPQTVNPNVNARNTRPMTAPSGPPSYFGGPSYSAAPSAFYASTQSTGANAASTYGALDLAPAPPGSSGGPAPGTFQYQVDTSPNLDYDTFRGRNFSLPDNSTIGGAHDPLGESSSEQISPASASTPFFYAPPAHHPAAPALRAIPVTSNGHYPTVLEAYPPGIMPAPLLASTSAILPAGSSIRPGSSGGLPPVPGAATRRGSGGKTYNFVQQAGQSTKRPRRRYDEIERMYNCDYPGCTKAYGTLNHLNSHKMMQKHGPKSTPAQFKEMRKAWRERKKAEAAAAARAAASAAPPAPAATALNGLPGLIPGQPSDRPRPSTSAGEYSFSMPAPFMTPLGAPVTHVYPQSGMALHQPQAGQLYIDPQQPHQRAVYPQSFATSSPLDLYGGANRPMTAPSYYTGAPLFGSSGTAPSAPLMQGPTGGASYLAPRQAVNGGGQPQQPPSGSLGAAASADRRFSLPTHSLGSISPDGAYQLPAPTGHGHTLEVKMPQPVHPATQSGYASLIHGGEAASLGLGTGAGGAARLVLGGQDDEAATALGEVTAQ
ncbi:hypothetical protein Rhopal_003235-T1 [Rhodotorula paludigena]|uniref:C2H2-type domain-containing protein n=1 Tax=Rhodotorula paludigena TaxID=86838 RepID=A0AAV5GL39_9BASI|nr:hypothetical protein Rhopal_003235-T1 [Rhodotorula paludigena]